MKYDIRIGTHQFAVQILDLGVDSARVTVDGAPFEVHFSRAEGSGAPLPAPPALAAAPAAVLPQAVPASPAAPGGGLLAPIPGVILEVRVNLGQTVAAGQIVAVMEAMKMENNLTAETAGTVREIRIQKGSVVATGDVLMVIG